METKLLSSGHFVNCIKSFIRQTSFLQHQDIELFLVEKIENSSNFVVECLHIHSGDFDFMIIVTGCSPSPKVTPSLETEGHL